MGMTLDTSFQILWEFSAFLQKKKILANYRIAICSRFTDLVHCQLRLLLGSVHRDLEPKRLHGNPKI